MSTENLKYQPKPVADDVHKRNAELTEAELRHVAGGLHCCAGVHYGAVVLEMRKAG